MADLTLMDATEQAERVRRGDVSPLELVDAAIRRIERHNPAINAVVTETFERARDAARAGLPDGPFRGVPFLLKDLQAADPGVRMTQGSALLRDHVADHEAELVSRFKRAGLAIVGRTNTPEFGIPPTTEPALFGPCRNPWSLEHSSGGSSGGAAAAVAARFVAMAHASDGGGSIRIPASCCGVFGLKPTRARTPLGPKVGESTGALVCEFAVTVSVRDTAALLDAAAGPAPGDPYAAPPGPASYAVEAQRPPRLLRVAVLRDAPNGVPVHPDCLAALDSTAALCAELGHDVDAVAPPVSSPAELVSSFVTVWTVGAAMNLRAAEQAAGRPATPEDVEPLTWALASMGRKRSAVDFVEATRALSRISREVAAFFGGWDVLLTPTLARPPVRLGELACPPEDPLRGFIEAGSYAAFTPLFNVTGQPAASVPLYFSEAGLPIGTQIVGRFGDELTVLRLATQLEVARPWAARVPALAG